MIIFIRMFLKIINLTICEFYIAQMNLRYPSPQYYYVFISFHIKGILWLRHVTDDNIKPYEPELKTNKSVRFNYLKYGKHIR